MWAFPLLRPYIGLQRLTVIPNHETFKWLLTYRESTKRLARWLFLLLEYDFDIQYRKGVKHKAADALSCLDSNGHDTVEIDDYLPGDLTIGSIADENDMLDLSDAYDDRRPFLDTVVKMETVAIVTTRIHKAQVDKSQAREALLRPKHKNRPH